MNRTLLQRNAIADRLTGPRGRAGLSLLEVLVACGILVFGLASVAALLPAAASLLGQAGQADRAGATTANAYAEVVTRGLLSADIFRSGTSPCVFGKLMKDVPDASSLVMEANPTELQKRIDPTDGFWIQDDLNYRPTATAQTPLNMFESGSAGIRSYNKGMCWGAMITCTGSATRGTTATLSIAVFKKEGLLPKRLQLTEASGLFKMNPPNESDLKDYLPGCSYVMAIPTAANQPPRWFRIASSWKQFDGSDCFVVFEDHEGFKSCAGADATVVAFQNLMHVEQYPVKLE